MVLISDWRRAHPRPITGQPLSCRQRDIAVTPHTLANALADMPLEAIAKSPTRHLLTKSFRSREFMPPWPSSRPGRTQTVKNPAGATL
ncbi:hypothetical protein NIBR502774_19715 (plasmid) [Rhizobium sp. NIBRBAC000502774]|nr:hypothetical protein NIBR502774_19715 [Rhizobium sp. NIBRBAC000502774]